MPKCKGSALGARGGLRLLHNSNIGNAGSSSDLLGKRDATKALHSGGYCWNGTLQKDSLSLVTQVHASSTRRLSRALCNVCAVASS